MFEPVTDVSRSHISSSRAAGILIISPPDGSTLRGQTELEIEGIVELSEMEVVSLVLSCSTARFSIDPSKDVYLSQVRIDDTS